MINLRNYIAPEGGNLRGHIWVLAGPWVEITKQCSINFPNSSGANVIINAQNFSYLTKSGSIKFVLNLIDANNCSIEITGVVDNKPVQEEGTGIPYYTTGNKLIINWSKFPLAIYRYHGENSTEIDFGNVPVINNASFWIGQ